MWNVSIRSEITSDNSLAHLMIHVIYTEPHSKCKMFFEDNLNSIVFKTKFGVVKSINLHALPAHTSQLIILPRFTEHWYVR